MIRFSAETPCGPSAPRFSPVPVRLPTFRFAALVHLAKLPGDAKRAGKAIVWSEGFADAANARLVFGWMKARPSRCLAWGHLAPIVGQERLSHSSAEEMLADAVRRAAAREDRRAENAPARRVHILRIKERGGFGFPQPQFERVKVKP